MGQDGIETLLSEMIKIERQNTRFRFPDSDTKNYSISITFNSSIASVFMYTQVPTTILTER